MFVVIVIVSFCLIVYQLVILFAPKTLRLTIAFFSFGSRVYLVGLVRLLFGILILTQAAQARFWAYAITVGLILAAFGLTIFFIPLKRTKKLLHRLQEQSDLKLRVLVTFGIVILALLIYAILPESAAVRPN